MFSNWKQYAANIFLYKLVFFSSWTKKNCYKNLLFKGLKPPIFMHSIFAILQLEITSLIFRLFQTWILQATLGRKIQFQL